ncbi:MAG: hypothetical protein AVDCRST_MAG32-2540, partial [uncultured Nocardioides sp.]
DRRLHGRARLRPAALPERAGGLSRRQCRHRSGHADLRPGHPGRAPRRSGRHLLRRDDDPRGVAGRSVRVHPRRCAPVAGEGSRAATPRAGLADRQRDRAHGHAGDGPVGGALPPDPRDRTAGGGGIGDRRTALPALCAGRRPRGRAPLGREVRRPGRRLPGRGGAGPARRPAVVGHGEVARAQPAGPGRPRAPPLGGQPPRREHLGRHLPPRPRRGRRVPAGRLRARPAAYPSSAL